MHYNINNSAWKIFKNQKPGGSGELKLEQYPEFINSNKQTISDLLKDLNEISISGDKYIFCIKYDYLPPKTKRLIFNPIPKNIDEVRQRSLIEDEREKAYKIFYELTIKEFQKFKSLVKEASLMKELGGKFTINYVNKTLFRLVNHYGKIMMNKPYPTSRSVEFTQLLFIEADIKDLINNGYLRDDNFIKEINAAYLSKDEYDYILKNYSWLIIKNISPSSIQIDFEVEDSVDDKIDFKLSLRDTVIGVIDSGINFSNTTLNDALVSYEDHRKNGDYSETEHGSIVSSLIVANDEFNPTAVDYLGNFKVKHFEVLEPSLQGGVPSVDFHHLTLKLKEIVKSNSDIKIWNLSFGSLKNPYTITQSPLAIFIDKLSIEFGVLFIIASGNERKDLGDNFMKSLNQPADALNALSCGSSTLNDSNEVKFSEYSSIGHVLHFEKPEVSHWGGMLNQDGSKLTAYDGSHIVNGIQGTSYSAPRISRLAAHLLEEGFNISEIKAKIIACAIPKTNMKKASVFGYIPQNKKFDSEIEISTTRIFSDNKPEVLDINLLDGVESLSVSMSRFVNPINKFGEEVSIHNIGASLKWYDSSVDEPVSVGMSVSVGGKKPNSTYMKEKQRRHEDGKYFNSKISRFSINEINIAREKLLSKGVSEKDAQLGVFIKKLDLFDTKELQKISASLYISIAGEIDPIEFENINEPILINHIEIDM